MVDDFPADLEQFIAQYVESLAQLEALLLMRSHPERRWTCDEFSRELYITAEMCPGIVADLERHGFVERLADSNEHFKYRPPNAELDRLVGRLGELYEQRRVAVITKIYSKPVKKVQTFADAFRLRRED